MTKPPLPTHLHADWPRIPVDDSDTGVPAALARIAADAANFWTVQPGGPLHQPGRYTPADLTRAQVREALYHLLELGSIDIDEGRFNAALSFPMQRERGGDA